MSNKSGSIIAALLGGAFIGAVTALLFAPKSGEELRKDVQRIVREKAQNFNREEIEALVNKVLSRIRDTFSIEQIEEAVDEAIAEQKAEETANEPAE